MRSIVTNRNLVNQLQTRTRTSIFKKTNLGILILLSRSPFHTITSTTSTSSRSITTSSKPLFATPTSLPINFNSMTSNSTNSIPPSSAPSWKYTPEKIAATVAKTIATSQALLDSVVALKPEERTFESVYRVLGFREGVESKEAEPSLFLQYVSTDAEIRSASVEADKTIQDFSLSSITRKDVYKALLDAQTHTEKNGIKLNDEEKRLMERMLLDRTRAGLGLTEDKQTELLEINKKIMGLEVDFQTNCNAENGELLFTAEELDGVPQDTIEGYPKVGDKFKVTFKTPDIIPGKLFLAHFPVRRNFD